MKNSVEESSEGDILNEWSMNKVLEGKDIFSRDVVMPKKNIYFYKGGYFDM